MRCARSIAAKADGETEFGRGCLQTVCLMQRCGVVEVRRGKANRLVLVVACKKNVSDLRESPTLDIIHLLEAKGAHVAYHDPHVPPFSKGHGDGGHDRP